MTLNSEARQKVFGTLLTSALLRWETLVTVMVTAILFLFVRDISLPFPGMAALVLAGAGRIS